MPSKIDPGDWDHLFAPNAPRRGGPLRALVNVLVLALVLILIGAGTIYAIRYRNQQYANAVATATVVAATVRPLQTQTAQAITQAEQRATATTEAQRTATVQAAHPTPEPGIGVGAVVRGGNLRSEPRLEAATVIGLIWPGDQIIFLERRDVGGQAWYRIRVTKEAANRGGAGVPAGTAGWASGTLLSQPSPVATP